MPIIENPIKLKGHFNGFTIGIPKKQNVSPKGDIFYSTVLPASLIPLNTFSITGWRDNKQVYTGSRFRELGGQVENEKII